MTDEQLMEQFIKLQNEQAYTVLYQKYFTEVCRYITWLLRDKDSAQDVVQSVFVKIYQNPEAFKTENNFKVWLFTIAKNAWRNELRANGVRKQNHEQLQFYAENSEEADHSERLNKIDVALKELSQEHREVFVLKYSNNLSLQEVADVCNCSLGTVKSRLFYALKNMRELVKTKEIIS